MSRSARAVLFDFGGTLYDYETLVPGDRESLMFLARLCGVESDEATVHAAYRASIRRVFRDYLQRPFFHHRDMFRDATVGAMQALGGEAGTEHFEQYRERQWELHRRDFRLREGVVETLGELRRRGLALGIVSNIDDDQLRHLGELAGLADHFDWLLSSEQVESCKPDSKIFVEALRRAKCDPAEALFVGDSLPQDIAGANRAGLRSVLLWHRPGTELPVGSEQPRHVIGKIPELLDLL